MSGLEIIVFLTVVGVAVAIIRLNVLAFRLVDRSARRLRTEMRAGARSLFGPGGSPAEIIDRLLQRHPELTRHGTDGLAFTCSGHRGRLDFISDLTEIRFELDGATSESMEVSTPSFITQLAEDDPDAFRIRGSQKLQEEVFRNSELQPMLRNWLVSFEWIVRPGEFTLRLRSQPRSEEELWHWLKGAYALLQALPGVGIEDPVQLARPTPIALAESSCQVCGTSMGQPPVVYCVRCRTPHHEECWEYAGRCSTFACQERRYSR